MQRLDNRRLPLIWSFPNERQVPRRRLFLPRTPTGRDGSPVGHATSELHPSAKGCRLGSAVKTRRLTKPLEADEAAAAVSSTLWLLSAFQPPGAPTAAANGTWNSQVPNAAATGADSRGPQGSFSQEETKNKTKKSHCRCRIPPHLRPGNAMPMPPPLGVANSYQHRARSQERSLAPLASRSCVENQWPFQRQVTT